MQVAVRRDQGSLIEGAKNHPVAQIPLDLESSCFPTASGAHSVIIRLGVRLHLSPDVIQLISELLHVSFKTIHTRTSFGG